jgi:hypothetical protein
MLVGYYEAQDGYRGYRVIISVIIDDSYDSFTRFTIRYAMHCDHQFFEMMTPQFKIKPISYNHNGIVYRKCKKEPRITTSMTFVHVIIASKKYRKPVQDILWKQNRNHYKIFEATIKDL